MQSTEKLSRRERQFMDIIWERGQASVAEVLEALPDPPGYNTVRALLGVLERKGHLTHTEEDGRYVYLPVAPAHAVAKTALERVVTTFFGGSIERTVMTLLQSRERHLSDDELTRLSALIAEAKESEKAP
ncbi:BlaI/MecI/CopY family transcriptional regulator [Armatimonas rosea]|uniref:Putative transcriptional regulator n=1 Tax=Armatimonas rosea TaxID=685828 RepID=A0A7W9SNP8_ARMRO|nr:BlaI/MecI/CopY family transcriptional regulator [Armatimonas rosea]MBB6049987.1 putative transcriptional regulator [Armatimonas rosea]